MTAATQKATLAAGCFWGVEVELRNTPGVTDAQVGYVGGKVVRWGTLASEEAAAAGRTPSRAARAAAAIPRLLRLPIGTR